MRVKSAGCQADGGLRWPVVVEPGARLSNPAAVAPGALQALPVPRMILVPQVCVASHGGFVPPNGQDNRADKLAATTKTREVCNRRCDLARRCVVQSETHAAAATMTLRSGFRSSLDRYATVARAGRPCSPSSLRRLFAKSLLPPLTGTFSANQPPRAPAPPPRRRRLPARSPAARP